MLHTIRRLKDSDIHVVKKDIYFNKDNENYCREIFYKFVQDGLISKKITFDDITWKIVDATDTATFNFKFNELNLIKSQKKFCFNKGLEECILVLKCFTLITLCTKSLSSTNKIIKGIIKHLERSGYFNTDNLSAYLNYCKNLNAAKYIDKLIDFLSYAGIKISEDYERILDLSRIDGYIEYDRKLPSFETMFAFDELINRFLKDSNLEASSNQYPTIKQKEKYYPIVLWWKITSMIPLRTTEFTVTPYDCIKEEKGVYKLKIRRSILKGRSGTDLLEHNLENYYQIEEIAINEEIYDLILDYNSLVDKYDYIDNFYDDNKTGEPRQYLLSHRSYLLSRNYLTKVSDYKDYLNARCFRSLLIEFFEEIIIGVYHYEVIEVSGLKAKELICKELLPHQVERIKPYDTRNFAIMNLIWTGIQPEVVKELAGHRDINTTYGYIDHMDKFVHNYTYHLAKKYIDVNSPQEIISLRLDLPPDAKTIYYLEKIKNGEIPAKRLDDGSNNGWCLYQKDDFRPCRHCGYECRCGCKYFVPVSPSIIEHAVKENRKAIDATLELISDLIDHRHTIKGFDKIIRTKLNLIRSLVEQNARILGEHVIR